MKIVYLGTDAFLSCFLWLLKEHEIMALYTCGCPEDFFRNLRTVAIAKELGIPVYEHTITTEEEKEWIGKGCELFLSADYGRKIPLLPEAEGFCGVNIHAAYLPEGRSYCPVECAMERELMMTGVTIHKLSEEFDCGDIVSQENVVIRPEDDSVDIYLKCDIAAKHMLMDLTADLTKCIREAVSQERKLPYWSIQHIESARFFHTMTLKEAKRIYRIYNRMVRVRLGEKVYFVIGFSSSTTKLPTDEIDLGDVLLYKVMDGHLRLNLYEAKDPSVWDAKKYPFSKE